MGLKVKIKKAFSGFCLDVDFETKGGCMGILGASGCGKSMTLKCIAGIEKPDEGSIVLNGKVLFDSQKKINLHPQLRKVGYLFQNYALFPTMTVEQNIGISIADKEIRRQKVASEIQRFQLQGLEKRYPSQLSGGQQQRVALARMLVSNPDIIMLDEPFSALDGYLKDVLQMELLEFLRNFKGDVLMVSHGRDEVFKFCGTMLLISDGKGILKGNTKDIFEKPEKMEAAKLTGCKNISKARKLGEYELMAEDWNIKLKTAEKVRDDLKYVAVRGHRLRPATDASAENTMKTKMAGYAKTPFEDQYLFCNADGEENARIWWMIERKKFQSDDITQLPEFMIFPREHIMQLS